MRLRLVVGAVAATFAVSAFAQTVQWVAPAVPSGNNNSFGVQNPLGPKGKAVQQNYPYEGQCNADPANKAVFALLNDCVADTGSFACVQGPNGPHAAQTAGGWMECGTVAPTKYTALNPIVADSAGVVPTEKFVWPVLNPLDYAPDTTTFPGADYYEIGVHEAWGFQAVASAALFPDPTVGGFPAVPNGMQWTGIKCNIVGGCACPAGLTGTFKTNYCTAAGGTKVPQGAPLYTPIWGVGQINMSGGPATQVLTSLGLFTPQATDASAWSANNYIATWPSISIRANKGTPVVVKWVNEFPNNHLFCQHPEAADWPCAIDRTFMGVKARIDPALATVAIPPDGVNLYGSPQQPDNSWVTHLHGGEIPPSTDGFAEKWFGNSVTAAAYDQVAKNFVMPPYENPLGIHLKRPTGNADTYTYPMVNEEATIWFHDHTLGKTHHNVIAGPAGFFPVREPLKHQKVTAGVCSGATAADCEYTWLDPVSEPRNALGIPLYDLFFALQDRAFSEDGSINFSNGLGQVLPNPLPVTGYTSVTPGVNPEVHPVWVPEYFGDHAIVNGVTWPKFDAKIGWYRIRIADGSDSRCWTLGFQTSLPAPGVKPAPNMAFWLIANDQGYLKQPIRAPGNKVTICPGERIEMLVNFNGFVNTPTSVYMTNEAAAPFPAGDLPYGVGTPFPEMNVVMRFDVNKANGYGVRTCGSTNYPAASSWDPAWTQAQMAANIASRVACMPSNPLLVPANTAYDGFVRPTLPIANTEIVRQIYLNERLDGFTGAPMGMQLNGVPFEYKTTETPVSGTKEIWQFINLTVDAHPMHPHFVRHLVIGRQGFSAAAYKTALCGSINCQPGPGPGNEMQTVPDVTPFLTATVTPVTDTSPDGGWKDAVQSPPGRVTSIVAWWTPRWDSTGAPTAPGTAGCPHGTTGCAAPYVYESVSSGPYVWHCHINSHEDSEMMRTSLVLPP